MDTLASVTSCMTSAGSSGSSYSKRSLSCLSSDLDEVGVPATPDLKDKQSGHQVQAMRVLRVHP
jgi:hypothetical protein